MKTKEITEKYAKKVSKRQIRNKKRTNYAWIIMVTLCALVISFGFSLLAELIIPNTSIVVAIITLLIFIFLGILFDMVGVAVTVSDEKTFHSMSAKKVKGARLGVKLISNAEKVSSFCNDVIGDICGIVSGSTSAMIATLLITKFNFNPLYITLVITSVVASLTIGGKALGKGLAIRQSNAILYRFARVLSVFYHR
ncbi:MAG: hypothetical protein RSB99_03180 [Bacilli bacterium]